MENNRIFHSKKDQLAFKQDSAEIPLHPKIKVGKLPNGFQYFIMQNNEPKERVLFYLANKVGLMQETAGSGV